MSLPYGGQLKTYTIDNVIVNPEVLCWHCKCYECESLFWQNKVVWILHWNMAYVGLVNEIIQLSWKFADLLIGKFPSEKVNLG